MERPTDTLTSDCPQPRREAKAGNAATHDFGQFAPLFLMTFQDVGSTSTDVSGVARAVPGPGGGATGEFPVSFNFLTDTRFRSALVVLGESVCGL